MFQHDSGRKKISASNMAMTKRSAGNRGRKKCPLPPRLPVREENASERRKHNHHQRKRKGFDGNQCGALFRRKSLLQKRVGAHLQSVVCQCRHKAAERHHRVQSRMLKRNAECNQRKRERKKKAIPHFVCKQHRFCADNAARLHRQKRKPERPVWNVRHR